MRIRPAAIDDVEGLAELHVAAWRAAYADILPADTIAAFTVERRRSGWGAALADPNRQNLLCEIDGRLCGFVSFGTARDADSTADTAEILALYVHPRHWGRGVGRALGEAAAAQIDARYAMTTVWVLRDNVRGRRFYEGLGFGPAIELEHAIPWLGGAAVVRYRRRRVLPDAGGHGDGV